MRELEAAYLRWLLEQTRGNRTAAARILGISYPTIQKKINDYGIDFKEIWSRAKRKSDVRDSSTP